MRLICIYFAAYSAIKLAAFGWGEDYLGGASISLYNIKHDIMAEP